MSVCLHFLSLTQLCHLTIQLICIDISTNKSSSINQKSNPNMQNTNINMHNTNMYVAIRYKHKYAYVSKHPCHIGSMIDKILSR